MAFLAGRPIDIEYLEQRAWWTRVKVGRPSECWPWLQSIASHGYGQTWDGITVRLAHRVAWTLHHGRQVSPGMTIDHTCRNRRCCNPAHLRELTNVDNATDNGAAGKTHCIRGHEFNEENTIVRTNEKGRPHRYCRACRDQRNARRVR